MAVVWNIGGQIGGQTAYFDVTLTEVASQNGAISRGFNDEPCRDRTCDHRIKSPVLYQLS